MRADIITLLRRKKEREKVRAWGELHRCTFNIHINKNVSKKSVGRLTDIQQDIMQAADVVMLCKMYQIRKDLKRDMHNKYICAKENALFYSPKATYSHVLSHCIHFLYR